MTHWHLASVNWLDTLPKDAVRDLRSQSQTKSFKDKEMVFAPAVDPGSVYLLETGLIRIYRLSGPGEEFTLCLVEPGEVFGELAILTEDARESFAVALDTCEVLKFPKSLFLGLMKNTPAFGLAISKQVGRRLERIEIRAEDLIFRSAASRLARTLLMLADDFGHVENGRMTIGLNLTQSEIATLIGSSRPTVNVTLRDFKRNGLIDPSGSRIVVVNRGALQKIADDFNHS